MFLINKKITNRIQNGNIFVEISAFCLAMHLILSVFFIYVDIGFLTLANIISVTLYVFACFLAAKGRYIATTLLIHAEVSANVLLSMVFLGWDNGFYFYAIAVMPLSFYCPFKSKTTKVLLSVYQVGVFVAGYLINYLHEPHFILDDYIRHIVYMINALLCLSVLIIISYLFATSVQTETQVLSNKNKRLQVLADTDPLTGLYNRRYIISQLEQVHEQFVSLSVNYVILMIDIDNFKSVNDRYGHDCGDIVLKTVSAVIKQTLRKDDIISRWGGEEILVLLPDTEFVSGIIVGEKVRAAIEAVTMTHNGNSISVTATVGVASSQIGTSVLTIINTADMRMYKGKAEGKNRVEYED